RSTASTFNPRFAAACEPASPNRESDAETITYSGAPPVPGNFPLAKSSRRVRLGNGVYVNSPSGETKAWSTAWFQNSASHQATALYPQSREIGAATTAASLAVA